MSKHDAIFALIGVFILGLVAGMIGYNLTHYRQKMKLEWYESVCRVNNVQGN